MTDWMNDLEHELASLTPRSTGRDLVAAALCAHQDSEVLTAKRLTRELSAEELETAFDVWDDKYPGLIAGKTEAAAPVAMAFIRTPSPEANIVRKEADRPVVSSGRWFGRVAMVAALMLCFAGGIAIGLRSGNGPNTSVVQNEKLVPTEPRRTVNDGAIGSVKADVAVVASEPVARESFRPVIRRVRYGRPRSTLTDLTRAYQRNRQAVSGIQASL